MDIGCEIANTMSQMMTCMGLTEEDEKHLLMLLDGDISDVKIEDEDEINYENEINEKKSKFNDSIEECISGTIIPVGSKKINVEVEIIENNEYDAEDDIALSQFLESSKNFIKSIQQSDVIHWVL
ncbi:hypothetical protein FQA39_LY07175 [Lamprigera yunnana]|nr:hypothetical protein FQA39_LY07175 [Lamprigera yunnana]